MEKPWAYIAHKGGYWAGLTCPGDDAGRFIAEFVDDGFTITTVFSREEYTALLKTMTHWHESPEYQAKHKPQSTHPDLFEAAP